jgi:hypothetical protein
LAFHDDCSGKQSEKANMHVAVFRVIGTRRQADSDLPGLIATGRGDVPPSGALEPGAYLEPGDLSGTVGLLAQQLHGGHGDAAIKLPEGLALPAH